MRLLYASCHHKEYRHLSFPELDLLCLTIKHFVIGQEKHIPIFLHPQPPAFYPSYTLFHLAIFKVIIKSEDFLP